MKTFCKIIHRQHARSKELINASLDNNIEFYTALYEYELREKPSNDKNKSTDISVKLFLFNFMLNLINKNVQHKYISIKNILDNKFITEEIKDVIMNHLCSAQRIYQILNRWVFRYKYKRMKPHNDCDLYMNPITENQRNVVAVLQNGQKYLFAVNDIVNLIDNALCNMNSYTASPKAAKNPYNNMPFEKAILCNIYFFLLKRFSKVPQLIQQYFYSGFNLTTFRNNNEFLIRNMFVDKYMKGCDYDKMRRHINEMLRQVKYYGKIMIDSEFPREKLTKIMYPYVELYIKYLYAYSNELCLYYIRELRKKLVRFYVYNPNFGKRMLNTVTQKMYIDDKHPEYININYFRGFDVSHLTVENVPQRNNYNGTENFDDIEDDEDEEYDEGSVS